MVQRTMADQPTGGHRLKGYWVAGLNSDLTLKHLPYAEVPVGSDDDVEVTSEDTNLHLEPHGLANLERGYFDPTALDSAVS